MARTGSAAKWIGLATAVLGFSAAVLEFSGLKLPWLHTDKSERSAPVKQEALPSPPEEVSPEDVLEQALREYDRKQYRNAFTLFKTAAKLDLPEAQWHVGEMLFHGEGILPDTTEAMRWVQQSANAAYAPAQTHLGLYILATENDTAEAKHWIGLGASQGDPTGQFCSVMLPWFSIAGGIEALLKEAKASELEEFKAKLRMAARSGLREAQSVLSQVKFMQAMSRLEQDNPNKQLPEISEAFYWGDRAARQGDVNAQSTIGIAYRSFLWDSELGALPIRHWEGKEIEDADRLIREAAYREGYKWTFLATQASVRPNLVQISEVREFHDFYSTKVFVSPMKDSLRSWKPAYELKHRHGHFY